MRRLHTKRYEQMHPSTKNTALKYISYLILMEREMSQERTAFIILQVCAVLFAGITQISGKISALVTIILYYTLVACQLV